MKFLCIECDEAMKLTGTGGPDETGSMTVRFTCASCGKAIAMLTNAMETQMVRALDVKIGGRSHASSPMEGVRGALEAEPHAPEAAAEPEESATGSKCPFSGAVADAYAADAQKPAGPTWTAEAEERMNRVPEFVRPMVKRSIEQHAAEAGRKEVDLALLDAVKGRYGL